MYFRRAPNRLNADLGQADVADVARLHHVGDGTYRILDRHVWIEARWPVDVDVIDAKAREAVREGVLRRSGTRVEPEELAIGSAERAELHAEQKLVAATFQRLADEKLVSPHAVEVTGVEDVHAALDRLVDRPSPCTRGRWGTPRDCSCPVSLRSSWSCPGPPFRFRSSARARDRR